MSILDAEMARLRTARDSITAYYDNAIYECQLEADRIRNIRDQKILEYDSAIGDLARQAEMEEEET